MAANNMFTNFYNFYEWPILTDGRLGQYQPSGISMVSSSSFAFSAGSPCGASHKRINPCWAGRSVWMMFPTRGLMSWPESWRSLMHFTPPWIIFLTKWMSRMAWLDWEWRPGIWGAPIKIVDDGRSRFWEVLSGVSLSFFCFSQPDSAFDIRWPCFFHLFPLIRLSF